MLNPNKIHELELGDGIIVRGLQFIVVEVAEHYGKPPTVKFVHQSELVNAVKR